MTFSDFDDMGNGLRLVATSIMDEEQFRVEGWHLYRGTEWRPTIPGIHAYAALREKRRLERKQAWRQREERDTEWTREIERMIEGEK